MISIQKLARGPKMLVTPVLDCSVFHVSGFINCHNCHYWASDEIDLKMTVERMQAQSKVAVWCGMTATRIIGLYLLRDTMNGQCYPQMVDDYAWPTVSDWNNTDDLIFTQEEITLLFI